VEFDGRFSMEFCLVLGHGIPWNSMKTFPRNSIEFHKNSISWNSVWYWDMEFHGIHENISMEFYGVPQKLNSTEFCLVSGL